MNLYRIKLLVGVMALASFRSLASLGECVATLEMRNVQTLRGVCSEENWAMDVSLTQQCQLGGRRPQGCKLHSCKKKNDKYLQMLVPANSVPAAAAILGEQVLFIVTGRIGCIGF